MDFNRSKKIFILLIIFTSSIFAQLKIDYAVFKENDSLSCLEIYYGVSKNKLQFQKKKNKYQARVKIKTLLMQNDSLKKGNSKTLNFNIPDTTELAKQGRLIEIEKFNIPPGKYRLKVTMKDENGKRQFRSGQDIQVKSFNTNELISSDLILAKKFKKTASKNRFSREFGYDLTPKVDAIFKSPNNFIYPFFELYNLSKDSSEYKVRYKITDVDNQTIKKTEWLTEKAENSKSLQFFRSGIATQNISSGSYKLKIIVVEKADTLKLQRDLFIINKGNNRNIGLNVENLKKLNEHKLDSLFQPLRYVASKQEKNRYSQLDRKGKIGFLSNFWNRRDPKPSTSINESRRKFERKLIYTDNRFGNSERAGWKTERGRVWMLYGEPLEIERNKENFDKKHHIIWKYNSTEKPVRFIFLKNERTGNYELIHSDARGEVKNQRWRQMLSKDSDIPVNTNR